MDKKTEALRMALEALETGKNHGVAIDVLRRALAEPVEPVGAAGLFTLAHLWAQQCYFKGLGRPCDIDGAKGAFEQALKAYTAPPQRKPLTRERFADCWLSVAHIEHATDRQIAYGRAIEAAHGITGEQK